MQVNRSPHREDLRGPVRRFHPAAVDRARSKLSSHHHPARIGAMEPLSPRVYRLAGAPVHRPRRVFVGNVEQINGLLVTDRATTLIDLAAVMGPGQYERVLDDQLSSHFVKLIEVVRAFDRQARRGRKGIALARGLIEERLDGLAASESELEHLFRELVEPHLPVVPVYQFQPSRRTEAIGRTDAGFPGEQLIAELDGRRWHLRDADFENDRRRDQEAHRTPD